MYTYATHTLSRTYEGQDAEAEVVSDGGDDGAHPQHGESGVTAGDDQVTRQIPKHVPAQQVTLKTAHSASYSLQQQKTPFTQTMQIFGVRHQCHKISASDLPPQQENRKVFALLFANVT